MKPKSGLYVTAGSTGNLYTMDSVTASVSMLFAAGHDVVDIAFCGETLYGITSSQLLRMNLAAKTCEVVGDSKLAVGADNTIYCIGGSGTGLYTVNSTSGVSTLIGTFAGARAGTHAIDLPSHGMTVDLNTGLMTILINALIEFNSLCGIEFYNGRLYGVTRIQHHLSETRDLNKTDIWIKISVRHLPLINGG